MSLFKFTENHLSEYLEQIDKSPILINNEKICNKIDLLKDNIVLNPIGDYNDIISDINYNIFEINSQISKLDTYIEKNKAKFSYTSYEKQIEDLSMEITKNDLDIDELVTNIENSNDKLDDIVEPILEVSNNLDNYIGHIKNNKLCKKKYIDEIRNIDIEIENMVEKKRKLETIYNKNIIEIMSSKEKEIVYFDSLNQSEIVKNCRNMVEEK